MLKDRVWEEMIEVIVPELHKGLKSKINASIYVTIQNDKIVVKITKNDLRWTYEVLNASEVVLYGGLCTVIDEIIFKYRRYILKMHFY